MEATEERTPSLPLGEWAEHVMSVTRKAVDNGSLDDLANDGSQQRTFFFGKHLYRLSYP